jgi:hypothetical protein
MIIIENKMDKNLFKICNVMCYYCERDKNTFTEATYEPWNFSSKEFTWFMENILA